MTILLQDNVAWYRNRNEIVYAKFMQIRGLEMKNKETRTVMTSYDHAVCSFEATNESRACYVISC